MNETRVGADVGGTFTDLVTVTDGQLRVDKTPSTPDAPEQGVLDGVDGLSVPPASVGFFGHGTTVATNAVLEGEWADTALVTTAGFEDVLEIGRQTRPDIYDFAASKPEPVVPRHRRYGVTERVDERGAVLQPLDEASVRRVGERIRESPATSVAIATLFAYERPAHEERIRELLREAGVEASISVSSTVLPEIREYERTLATALNAGLKPVMDRYLAALAAGVADRGIDAPVRIMGSNGGLLAEDAARERPVTTLLSGPAAGVRGAIFAARRAEQAGRAGTGTDANGTPAPAGDDSTQGYTDLLTMDMGGTSCDVSLVQGGEPTLTSDTEVGEYPVSVPTVDIHTVGAGGGSIAHVDDGGALRVGPASAGAEPGPVCYGRGGEQPTVTDAQFLLGRIDPSAFVGEAMAADRAAVRAAFDPLADELGRSVRETAAGVLEVANATTERALRVVSVERGLDPREFTLVAFGGAGPLHAAALADRLDVPRVIVPRGAGVLSALGLLVSDVTYEYASSMVRPFEQIDPATVADQFETFETEGRAALDGTGREEVRFERSLDLRYVGQSFELSVPAPDEITAESLAALRERFHDRHRRRYGHADPEEPIELVTVRTRARGVVEPPTLAVPERDGAVSDARRTRRSVTYDQPRETPVYDRTRLPTRETFDGPAIVEGPESTVVVHPGQRVRVDRHANLVIEMEGDG